MSDYVPSEDDMRGQYVSKRMNDGATRTHAEQEYRRWLAAHDARVRRDGAIEALDELYEDALQDYRIGLQGDDQERMDAAEAVMRATYEWMDNYPEETL